MAIDVEGHHEMVRALARVIADTADSAILDAFLTKQAVVADTIIYTGSRADDLPSTRRLVVESMVGTRPNRARDASERLEADVEAKTFRDGDPVNLVVIDLLWLDGEWLLDVPLLERKRLLEAIVPGDDLVRPSPYVRPPDRHLDRVVARPGVPRSLVPLGQLAVSPGRDGARLDDHPDAPSLTGSATRVPGGVWYGLPVPDSALTPAIREQIARIGKADIMVGIPSFKNAATIGYVVRAAQAGLVQYFPDLHPVVVNADAGSPDGTGRVVIETEPPDYIEQILLVRPSHKLERVSLTYPEIDGVGGKGAALRMIFEMAAALEVQALVVVDSDLRSIVPEWIELLSGPILKGGYDFVAPLYARYKYDGTITNTVTYPLTRALYGHRIRQPIGGDFGCQRRPRPALPDARRLDPRGQQVRHRHLDDDLGAGRRVRGLPDPARSQGPRPEGSRARTSGRCSARSSARSCGSPTATPTTGWRSTAATMCRPTGSSGSSTRRRSR